jgi:hypothetical protein
MRIMRTIFILVASIFACWTETSAQESQGLPAGWRRGVGTIGAVPPRSKYDQTASQVRAVGNGASTQPQTGEPHKYRPPLSPQQIAHPSNYHEQYLVALSAYDEDLVRIAQVRFPYNNQRLEWLQKAQQQRDANNINKTKPLIYPVR